MNSGVQFSIVPTFSGRVSVKEVFTETLVPLLKDRTLARQLNPGDPTIDVDRVSPAYYTDLHLAYNFDVHDTALELFGSVANLFDRDPPIAANHSAFGGSVQTNAALFDVLGRRFVVGARLTF